MRIILILFFINFSIIAFAQPQIEFEITEFDFGQITQAGTIKKIFEFTNIGDEPLIISRARTGDGGSYATYPKEPILPNEKGIITFHYNSKRIGRFQRRIQVESNSEPKNYKGIRVKGEVIRKRTTVEVREQVIDIGKINFKNLDTVTFELKNSGFEKLYLKFDRWQYFEQDLFFCKIESLNAVEIPTKLKSHYEPNESVKISFALRNIYGETGDFERNFNLIYNSYDTITLTIKGEFVGKPVEKTIYESNCVFVYNGKRLIKKITYNGSGGLNREEFFEGSYCVQSIIYNNYENVVRTERFYKKGKLVETKVVKK